MGGTVDSFFKCSNFILWQFTPSCKVHVGNFSQIFFLDLLVSRSDFLAFLTEAGAQFASS